MRHIVAYLLVVGGPLLGLLGVLRIGRDIRAPMSVHGAYVLQVSDSGAVRAQPCLRYLLSGTDSTLRITQSGAQVAATLGPEKNVALRGDLDGDRLRLAGAIDAAAVPDSNACASGDTLYLTVRASRDEIVKRLDGTAAAPTILMGCAPVAFSPDGQVLASGGAEGIRLWWLDRGNVMCDA